MGFAEGLSTANTALGIIWQVASKFIPGTPDWAKYVSAGVGLATRLISIIAENTANPGKYDAMSAAEVLTLLMPADWDQIEAEAKSRLGL